MNWELYMSSPVVNWAVSFGTRSWGCMHYSEWICRVMTILYYSALLASIMGAFFIRRIAALAQGYFPAFWQLGLISTAVWIALWLFPALLLIRKAWAKWLPAFTRKKLIRFRYSLWRRLVLTVLLLGFLLIPPGLLWREIASWEAELESSFRILVTRFYTEGPEQYLVTQDVIKALRLCLEGYAEVVPLRHSVTEEDPPNLARNLGSRFRCDLVIWGRYATSKRRVNVQVYVENLTELKSLSLPRRDLPMLVPIAKAESFELNFGLADMLSAFALFVSGLVHYELENYTEAIDQFSQAELLFSQAEFLTDEPERLLELKELYYFRGSSYLVSHEVECAVDDFTRAIESDHRFALAYVGRGIAHLRKGDTALAIEDLNAAIDIDSSRSSPFNVRGITHVSRGEFYLACEDFTKAINIDPQFAGGAYFNRGVVREELGDHVGAIEDFTKAIEINPTLKRLIDERSD